MKKGEGKKRSLESAEKPTATLVAPHAKKLIGKRPQQASPTSFEKEDVCTQATIKANLVDV